VDQTEKAAVDEHRLKRASVFAFKEAAVELQAS
jgi:hypothetical protein